MKSTEILDDNGIEICEGHIIEWIFNGQGGD